MPTLLEIVKARRSWRKYGDRAVEPEKIALLEQTARSAARAFGCHSVRMVFVTDPEDFTPSS